MSRPSPAWTLLLLLIPSIAAADAIGPEEPLSCPDGAQAATNHCGTVCFAPSCASDADCDASERCATVPYCTEELTCGGAGATFTAIRGTCSGGCSEGTCTDVRTCFPADRVDPDGTVRPENVRYGCGCRTAGGATHVSWTWLALFGLAGIRRRARR
ncbi:MAG: MYXO-CTERM sorting domain-containing protein [Sandaracinaceae bacterium]